MAYTDLQTLRGLSSPVDYGSGVEYATASVLRLLDETRSLQLGLWLNGTIGCRDILSGALDSNIRALFDYLIVETPANVTYLRLGYEFDNPAFGHSTAPDLFVHAFRHLVDACSLQYSASICRSKISFVWHSWAAGVPNETTLSDFYPGDAYVEMIGVSIFSQVYGDQYERVGTVATVRDVLLFAVDHNKPIMIGESTPFWGIPTLNDPWNDWFEPVLELIDEFDVSIWCYINCDWTRQAMWKNAGTSTGVID